MEDRNGSLRSSGERTRLSSCDLTEYDLVSGQVAELRKEKSGYRKSGAFLAPVRKFVSADRVRFKDGTYDLDLTYITPQIVAMGFPASGIESAWRNHINDVADMLNKYHAGCYMVWNLSDKTYDYGKFLNNIQEFGFPDHHSPPLDMLFKIVLTMDNWLKASNRNIAVVHCLGGKGRTGTVIACYLVYSGLFRDPVQALEHFAVKRSKIENGVKQASQLRYVMYFHQVLSRRTRPVPKTLKCNRVVMNGVPLFSKRVGGCTPVLQVFQTSSFPASILYSSSWVCDASSSNMHHSDGGKLWDVHCIVSGDTLISCTHYDKKKPVLMFRFSFHTAFISGGKLRLHKEDLDGIKDKK